MSDQEIRELIWGVSPLSESDPTKVLEDVRRRVNEKFVIGKDVRLSVPEGTPVTPQMVKLFVELGELAFRHRRHFYLRLNGCVARVVEQTPGSGSITIETIDN